MSPGAVPVTREALLEDQLQSLRAKLELMAKAYAKQPLTAEEEKRLSIVVAEHSSA